MTGEDDVTGDAADRGETVGNGGHYVEVLTLEEDGIGCNGSNETLAGAINLFFNGTL